MKSELYCINRTLLIFPSTINERRVFIAELRPDEPPFILNDPRLLSAFSKFPRFFSKDDAKAIFSSCKLNDEAEALFTAFLSENIIMPYDPNAASEIWLNRGWGEAYSYQISSRSYPFVQMDTAEAIVDDAQRMDDYKTEEAPPSPFTNSGSSSRVPLKEVDADNIDVLLKELREQPFGARHLAVILSYCAGIRGIRYVQDIIPFVHKSVPSGGGRHPSEVTVIIPIDTDELSAGIYQYNTEYHALDMIERGSKTKEFLQATYGMDGTWETPTAGFVFSSRVCRAMWRYRDPRSAKAVLNDIGHIVMAWRTVLGALNLNHMSLQKFDDQMIAKLCKLNPFAEVPLYVGTIEG